MHSLLDTLIKVLTHTIGTKQVSRCLAAITSVADMLIEIANVHKFALSSLVAIAYGLIMAGQIMAVAFPV